MQHVLVTGGAGYIGSILCRMLVAAGFRVTALDRELFGVNGTQGISHDDFRSIHGNILDRDLVRNLMKQSDHVVHLAAIVGEPACNRWPELAEETNHLGTNLLVSEAVKGDIQRFVFASTCSNYGIMGQDDLLDERSPLQPLSAYARHKVEGETAVLTSSIAVPAVLRFATAFGLSPRMRFDLTVNHFTKDACTGLLTDIYGATFWRPYAHIYDISRSILLALTLPEEQVRKRVFNVGTTAENYTKAMIASLIHEEVPGYQYQVHPVSGSDPRNYRVDFTKIAMEWGFEAEKTVRSGIQEIRDAFQAGAFPEPDHDRYANHRNICT